MDRQLARSSRARWRILVRVERLASGNPGDVKALSGGVSELRVHFGPGYRVYFTQRGHDIVILLAGGGKSTQPKDIQTALQLANNLEK
jgi:putative addiction module killer protein